jgi:DHA1 family bicyclomycin/chloramphenicol resistance-like MFS transporter
VVIARSIVRDLFDQRESAKMYSLLMLVMGIAPITAPLLGGQILVTLGWRAIFLTLSGFGLICFLLVLFGLPETMPTERRTPAGLEEVLKIYGILLKDRHFMGYALSSGLTAGAMFAYITGSPFVFIELNSVPPERYGWLFGTNAVGLILAAQLNHWLLSRYHSGQILTVSLAITATSGLLLTVITTVGIGGFIGMLILLFCCIASIGLVQPNAMAAAMVHYGRQAGSAAALFGAVRFVISAGAGALVGVLHNGTALPMVGTIALCSVTAFLILQLLALRPLPKRSDSTGLC